MNLRSIFCQLFKCKAFTTLSAAVTGLVQSAADLLSKITGVEEKLTVIESKIQEIMDKQFPLAEIQAIGLMVGLLLKPPLSIWLDVPQGAHDETIEIAIAIKGEPLQENTSWGLDFHFNPDFFSFVGVVKGELCESWANIAGNEIEPGVVRCGGYAGDGKPIIGETIGTIALVQLKVLASEGETDVSIDAYVDGIENFIPLPAIGTFHFKE